jgi:hypothetical protein
VTNLDYNSISAKRYKLFEQVEVGEISRVNIIIGKNNSGKSSLLDVIGAAYDVNQYVRIKSDIEEITVGTCITEKMVQDMFGTTMSYAGWNAKTLFQEYDGKKIEGKISAQDRGVPNNKWKPIVDIVLDDNESEKVGYILKNGACSFQNYIDGNVFRKVAAERDIVPEKERDIKLESSGEGATNLIRMILNYDAYDELLIEGELLEALNEITCPETEYEKIRVQQIRRNDESFWEVFLQEKGAARIPLSKTGSGIKTIILMLLNLIVVPQIYKSANKKYIYGFEELENNLHPAMQRKVFEFLYDYAVENDITIFLTTHSHVAINCFYGKPQACIFHVIKNNGTAEVKHIESYLDKVEILSDLDVKASDILQANGIIWVEGPSDRIYIKRWLEIFTDNRFKEGQHYQFLYYGGRLLSQYALKEDTDLISILTTNRNAAIVIDSDKRNMQASINSTKKRIVKEFDALQMFSWVTKGKEIENYITAGAVSAKFERKVNQCDRYELFSDYIFRLYRGFTGKKVQFAGEISPYITLENTRGHLDLEEKIKKLYTQIEKWNGMQMI